MQTTRNFSVLNTDKKKYQKLNKMALEDLLTVATLTCTMFKIVLNLDCIHILLYQTHLKIQHSFLKPQNSFIICIFPQCARLRNLGINLDLMRGSNASLYTATHSSSQHSCRLFLEICIRFIQHIVVECCTGINFKNITLYNPPIGCLTFKLDFIPRFKFLKKLKPRNKAPQHH